MQEEGDDVVAMWLSLILPCYNVERYVERCVQSILADDFTDYEIVLVNDGSTDDTAKCCDELAKKHSRVRAIHKENGGLASARNAGLEAAQGKYIWFVDSDDWIEPNALTKLYQTCCAEEPEVIKFAYCRMEKEKTEMPVIMAAGLYKDTEAIDQLRRKAFCEAGKYCLSAWTHVYRRDFLNAHQLRFVSERVVGSEDYLFNLQVLLHVRCLQVLPASMYTYEIRSGSLTQTYKSDLMVRYGILYQMIRKYYRDHGFGAKLEKLIDRFYVWHLAIGTAMVHEYSMLNIGKSQRQVRDAARAILKREDVQCAVSNADQTGMRWQKKVQCYGIRMRFEGLFFWLYVVKPRMNHRRKRKDKE